MTEPRSGESGARRPQPHGRWRGTLRSLVRPVDAASLGVFRALLGCVLTLGLVRFWAEGWIEKQYAEPSFFFKYPGFGWVEPWDGALLYVHFAALIAVGVAFTLGWKSRLSALLFGLGFLCVQLWDVTNYLNHYYQAVLLCLLLAVTPSGRAFSIDALRRAGSVDALRRASVDALRRAEDRPTVQAWALNLLRFQVAVVYLHAALAKVHPDWLVHGQPMGIWMASREGTALIGPLLALPWVPLAMSWAGFLYDLTVVPLLLWRRTRPFAFAGLLVFHGLTHVFFDIGLFPFIMTVSATLFFAPNWPRRALARFVAAPPVLKGRVASTPAETNAAPAPPAEHPWATRPSAEPAPAWAMTTARGAPQPPMGRVGRVGLALGLAYCAFQLLFPLRHLVYPGDVLWNEQGMRFAWKVMVREKNGSVTYHVRDPATDRHWQVSPARYLTWRQMNEMSAQPDLIRQLARHVADDFARRGVSDVEVRAEAWVSLNGRAPALLVDPDVPLTGPEVEALASRRWLRPAPSEGPLDRPVRRPPRHRPDRPEPASDTLVAIEGTAP